MIEFHPVVMVVLNLLQHQAVVPNHPTLPVQITQEVFQTDQLTIHHPQLTRLIVALKAHPRAHQAHQIVALQVLQVAAALRAAPQVVPQAAAHLQVLQAAHQVALPAVHLPAAAHQEADLPVVAAHLAAHNKHQLNSQLQPLNRSSMNTIWI